MDILNLLVVFIIVTMILVLVLFTASLIFCSDTDTEEEDNYDDPIEGYISSVMDDAANSNSK
jgi:hypothetical protein